MRVRIADHNKPGASFLTPHGIVRTDGDGNADVSPEQLAHLKSRKGLQITTRDIQPSDLSTREIRGGKKA